MIEIALGVLLGLVLFATIGVWFPLLLRLVLILVALCLVVGFCLILGLALQELWAENYGTEPPSLLSLAFVGGLFFFGAIGAAVEFRAWVTKLRAKLRGNEPES